MRAAQARAMTHGAECSGVFLFNKARKMRRKQVKARVYPEFKVYILYIFPRSVTYGCNIPTCIYVILNFCAGDALSSRNASISEHVMESFLLKDYQHGQSLLQCRSSLNSFF